MLIIIVMYKKFLYYKCLICIRGCFFMNKKRGIIGVFICVLLAGNITSALNSCIEVLDEKKVLNDDIKDYIEITMPTVGNLYIFGKSIGVASLASIKWGIVIDFELNVETNSSDTFDYVIFTLTNNKASTIEDYKINVSEYPYRCCFKDIPTRFFYTINATAYKNSTKVAWDQESPIAYIRIPPYDTP